jgi:hypothetical protein
MTERQGVTARLLQVYRGQTGQTYNRMKIRFIHDVSLFNIHNHPIVH